MQGNVVQGFSPARTPGSLKRPRYIDWITTCCFGIFADNNMYTGGQALHYHQGKAII